MAFVTISIKYNGVICLKELQNRYSFLSQTLSIQAYRIFLPAIMPCARHKSSRQQLCKYISFNLLMKTVAGVKSVLYTPRKPCLWRGYASCFHVVCPSVLFACGWVINKTCLVSLFFIFIGIIYLYSSNALI